MSSPPAGLQGEQRPRLASYPPSATSAAEEAIELCELAGLYLDPWQRFVLMHSLGEREDGKWAAFEVGIVVPRQNGKNTILEARELVGLFLLPEKLLVHSAHQFDTSLEAFRRLQTLIEECPDLDRRVQSISRAHGNEGIELKDGSRIRFRTRTKGGGRGFTCDWLGLDEAMVLPESFLSALLPTLSAKSQTGNPQVWYTASAVDQLIHEYGVVLARIRERGLKGDDPSLAYFEWSAEFSSPEEIADPTNQALWAAANPGLGIRISTEHIAHEQRSMDQRGFAVERLGVGDWPRTDGLSESVISPDLWASLIDPDSTMLDPVFFVFDVNPERTKSSISAAGRRADGLFHVEVIDNKPGTGWVPQRLAELKDKHQTGGIACDGYGPAASLIRELEPLGVDVQQMNSTEHGQACGLMFDLIEREDLRHLGQPEMMNAIRGAARRTLGEAWAWSRRSSRVDITPLVSGTLAVWLAAEHLPKQEILVAWA